MEEFGVPRVLSLLPLFPVTGVSHMFRHALTSGEAQRAGAELKQSALCTPYIYTGSGWLQTRSPATFNIFLKLAAWLAEDLLPLASRLAASASFPSFPDVGAPPPLADRSLPQLELSQRPQLLPICERSERTF